MVQTTVVIVLKAMAYLSGLLNKECSTAHSCFSQQYLNKVTFLKFQTDFELLLPQLSQNGLNTSRMTENNLCSHLSYQYVISSPFQQSVQAETLALLIKKICYLTRDFDPMFHIVLYIYHYLITSFVPFLPDSQHPQRENLI